VIVGEKGSAMWRPTAIIFDMDGVLTDSEPLHAQATRMLLAAYGVDYVQPAEENFFGLTDREVFRILKRRYGLEIAEDELAAAWCALVVRLLPERLVPMPGAPDVLRALGRERYRLALASGSAPEIIAGTLKALGVEACFEQVVSGAEVGRGKPAPDVFLETARRLAVPPAGCLVVEDSRNGLLAATAAGMACAVVPCRSTAGQDFAEATVNLASLTDLLAFLGVAGRAGLHTDPRTW
jgi:HAD superfamily hydrolase (TIGR01509 family)